MFIHAHKTITCFIKCFVCDMWHLNWIWLNMISSTLTNIPASFRLVWGSRQSMKKKVIISDILRKQGFGFAFLTLYFSCCLTPSVCTETYQPADSFSKRLFNLIENVPWKWKSILHTIFSINQRKYNIKDYLIEYLIKLNTLYKYFTTIYSHYFNK